VNVVDLYIPAPWVLLIVGYAFLFLLVGLWKKSGLMTIISSLLFLVSTFATMAAVHGSETGNTATLLYFPALTQFSLLFAGLFLLSASTSIILIIMGD